MKKFLLLFFASHLCNAQNKRFIYEYSAVADSTNRSDVHKEFVILDINSDGSLFYSLEKFKSDSIQAVEFDKQANSGTEFINVRPTYKGKIYYSVSKNYPEFKTSIHTGVGNDRYNVHDDREMVWKLSSEKMKIGEFDVQRAETKMYRRNWTAWFATEIPVQDGPYKFHGLPGLILKIEDESKSYSFELKGISKFIENNKLKTDEERNYNKEIVIDYTQFKKLKTEENDDPTKSLREMINSAGANFKMFGPDGTEVKPSDMLRQREIRAKEERKKNNNPLELDLLK